MTTQADEVYKISAYRAELPKQLAALERVCDKRHSAQLACGLTDEEASQNIIAYIDGWIARHGKYSEYKKEFALDLRAGYATVI